MQKLTLCTFHHNKHVCFWENCCICFCLHFTISCTSFGNFCIFDTTIHASSIKMEALQTKSFLMKLYTKNLIIWQIPMVYLMTAFQFKADTLWLQYCCFELFVLYNYFYNSYWDWLHNHSSCKASKKTCMSLTRVVKSLYYTQNVELYYSKILWMKPYYFVQKYLCSKILRIIKD